MALTLGFGIEKEAEIWIVSFLSSKIRPLFNSKEPWQIKNAYFFLILAFIVSFHLCFCQPGLPTDFSICFLFCFSSFIRALCCFSFIYVYPLLWFYPTTGGTFSQCLFSLGLFSYSAKVLLSFLPAQRNLFTIRNQNLRKNRISSLIDVG